VKGSIVRWTACAATAAAIFDTSFEAHAKGEIGFGVSYEASAPIGSFRSFLTDPSWQGFQGSLDFFLSDSISIGAGGQFSLFRQDFGSRTVQIQDGAVTAETFQYAPIWSVFGVVRAYFLPRTAVRPYLALGVGAADVTHAVLTSDIVLRDDTWGLMLEPSAGVFYRIGPNPSYGLREDPAFGLSASVSYSLVTASFAGVSSVSCLGAQIGVYSKY